jgi:hypothetical protein
MLSVYKNRNYDSGKLTIFDTFQTDGCTRVTMKNIQGRYTCTFWITGEQIIIFIQNTCFTEQNFVCWWRLSKCVRILQNGMCIDKNEVDNIVDSIYPNEMEIKDTTECSTYASYLDLLLKVDTTGNITTQLYVKWYDFNFNFPYLCSNIPSSSAYCVYIVQLIWYWKRTSFSSKHSTNKQFDITRVSTISFAGSFLQALWLLQRYCLPIWLFFGTNTVRYVSHQSLGGSWHTDADFGW